jgi:NAD-dependent SIR2 family protein deacetylase
VSVAAGIPAFRGSGGIHAQKMDDVAIRDLMSINALKVPPYSIITYQNSNGEDRMLACLKIIAN